MQYNFTFIIVFINFVEMKGYLVNVFLGLVIIATSGQQGEYYDYDG